MKKVIREGEMIPKYYGVAYLEIDRLVAVAYPIPLNIVVGFIRKIWEWLRVPKGLYEKQGYQKGYSEGRKYAFNQYKQQVLTQEGERLIKRGIDIGLDMLKKMRHSTDEELQGYLYREIDKELKDILQNNL